MQKRLEGGVRLTSNVIKSPLVSILVVVFRDKDELGKLLANLVPFGGADLELVVIDGGSADGSRELLQEHDAEIDYWLSEPDKGIYDAMNKGLKTARGRWVLHINAGDELLSIPYETLRSLGEDAEMLGCRVQHPEDHFTFIPRMNWTFRFQSTLHHQGTFYRREAHCGYDPTYKVLGDVAATQRMVLSGHRVKLTDHVISVHHAGGVAALPGNDAEWSRSIRENYGVLHQYAHKYLFMPSRRRYRSLRKRIG